MIALTFALRPRTAFATLLLGDTLFGQLCWTLRAGFGEARLTQLLAGYTAGQPFLVVADAFPAGYLPLPALPAQHWAGEAASAQERKALKQKTWLPHAALALPLDTWQQQAVDRRPANADFSSRPQPRNSLNRLTNATGKGDGFSPYTVRQHWYGRNAVLDLHVCLDESRLSRGELFAALTALGTTGFGKDANVGLGKFDLDTAKESSLPAQTNPDAWLTLAPCAPQGLGWNARRCYYRPFTRYGRHGDIAARCEAPFKSPLLLAAAGALLVPQQADNWSRGWVGQGLGDDGTISRTLPQTVHQGYAPAIPVRLPEAA
jgi:CRISPR-associated protein Csm4